MVKYYTEYFDSVGHKHYAIHCYNPYNGFVTMLKDYKF